MIYKSDEEYYLTLNTYLDKGYKIKTSDFPYLELEKDQDKVIIDLDKDKKTLNEIVLPDYDNSLINIINSIKQNYGDTNKAIVDTNIFDKKYKNTIILILDGMGKNILDEFERRFPSNFLSKNYYKNLTAIYPSTTACATTSIKSGLVPFETSWTGWSNYFKEVDKDLVLFMGCDYYTEEKYNITAYDILPYKMYYEGLDVKGASVEPIFPVKECEFDSTLSRALDKLNQGYQTLYVYDTEPDGLMHKYGTKSDKVYSTLNKYSKKIEKFYNKLPKDTLLLISADHGHIDNINIKFYLDKYLYSLLERRPTNDQRCLTFKVKGEKHKEFKEYFNSVYSSIYDLYSKDEFIGKDFVGHSNIKGARLDEFLGDYIAIAKTNYTLCLKEKSTMMMSNHAGYTKEEMVIPLIVLKK